MIKNFLENINMEYDTNLFPIESIERVKEQLRNKDINKALKTFHKNNFAFADIKNELEECINWLYEHKSYGVILSAYYKFGKCADFEVNDLLIKMFEAKDYPSFLKQAYRFDRYNGFEDEIECAIQWHENKNLNDTKAWRNKFIKLYEIDRFQRHNVQSNQEISILEEINDPIKDDPKILKITPIKQSSEKNDYKLKSEPEDDPYIISKVAKIKLENANNLHKNTNRLLRQYLAFNQLTVMESKLIDTYSVLSSGPAIFEVKSITEENEREQIRHAISQLYEYRFLHSIPNASLWIVFSTKPYSQWYIDYLLNDREIKVLWVDGEILAGPSLGLIK